MKRYLINILLAFDQLLNTLLLGHPDETLSSRLGRAKGKERYIWVKWLRIAVDFVFAKLGDENHCENSVMRLEQRNMRKLGYELWSWTKPRKKR